MSASSSSDSIPPPLSQGWGYGVTVGFGLAFAAGMHFVSRLLKKHTGEDNSHFETYATAGRTVGVGLTCVAVISSWAWSTALLSSSVVANSYGVAGPYAFAAGCLVQVSISKFRNQETLRTNDALDALDSCPIDLRFCSPSHSIQTQGSPCSHISGARQGKIWDDGPRCLHFPLPR